jgi:tetratricopeptide (TPR) repeat protein
VDLTHVEKLMMQGDWPAALHESQSLFQVHPISPKINGYIGLCFFRMNRFEEAIEAFKRATILDDNYADAGIKHAQALDKLQRFDEALEVAEYWLGKRPNDRTLTVLVNGLRRQVGEKLTDAWQKSVFLGRHNVFITHHEAEEEEEPEPGRSSARANRLVLKPVEE